MEITIEMLVGAYFLGRCSENAKLKGELAMGLIFVEIAKGQPSLLTLQLMQKLGDSTLEQLNGTKPAAG